MSYTNAQKVLPKELIEAIQHDVSGASIYIPSAEKKHWGSQTKSKHYYKTRNREILEKYQRGKSAKNLAEEYSLTEKASNEF